MDDEIVKSNYITSHKQMTSSEIDYEWDDFLNFTTGKHEPINIPNLRDRYVKWFKTPKSYKINQFTIANNMTRAEFFRLIDRHPILKDAHQAALESLASNRELGILDKKLRYDAGTVFRCQGQYCDEWKTQREIEAALRSKADAESSKHITVNFAGIKYEPKEKIDNDK